MLVAFIHSNEESKRRKVALRNDAVAWTAALALAVLVGVAGRVDAQTASPGDVAARLNGHWKLNEELTPPSARPAGRGRGQPSYAIAGAPAQRGGRGGGAAPAGGGAQPGDASSPLMAEEVAAQAALSILHQVPKEVTIEATADNVVFREPRGEWRFKIDGKSSAMEVPGGTLHSKSRWDHGMLRQEFSSAHKKLVKSWSIDANGRLVLTERFESFTTNSESKAVFDRQ
jgi:hypothetical protein